MNSIKAFFVLRNDYKEFPDDDKFAKAFETRDIYNMRSRNFILSHLENSYNSEMSDNPFMVKMDMEGGFKESALRLNAYLVKLTEWNEHHIKKRAALQ